MIFQVVADQSIHWAAVKDREYFSIVLIVSDSKYFIRLKPSIKDLHYYQQYLIGIHSQTLPSQRIKNIINKLAQITKQEVLANDTYYCDQWGNLSIGEGS